MQKVFYLFSVVLLIVLCVFVLLVCKKAQKGYFPAVFEAFFLFSSPKGLSFKSFFSSYYVLFPCFPFVFPFKIPSLFFAFIRPF